MFQQIQAMILKSHSMPYQTNNNFQSFKVIIDNMMKKLTLLNHSNQRYRQKDINNQNFGLLANNRKDSSEGFTNFETYPHNQFDPQENSELLYKDEPSICPSIQENMGDMEQYLEDLSNQLKIKTSALKTAEEYIEVLQDNLHHANSKIKKLSQSYSQSLTLIQKLESELGALKSGNKNDDTGKKSITRTVITDRNSINQNNCEALKIISNQIFNQFTESYYSLIDQLSNWVEREIQEQKQQGFFAKMQSNQIQIDDMIFEFPQFSSNISNPNPNILDQSYIPYYNSQSKSQPFINSTAIQSNTPEEYQKVIKMYCDYSKQIYSMLCQCINNMSTIAQSFEKITSPSFSPRTMIPPQLFNVIVREVSEIYSRKNMTLRKQNEELRNILDSLIGWIKKNGKNPQKLQNFSFCPNKMGKPIRPSIQIHQNHNI